MPHALSGVLFRAGRVIFTDQPLPTGTKAEAVVNDVLPSERLDQRRRSSVLSKVSSTTSGSGSWKDVKELFRTKSNKS